MTKRTFPVEYAILGLLSQGPLHGYALRRRVDTALSSFWTIATSQIYSALHSMQKSGLLSVEVQTQESRPPRNVYLITAKGRQKFDRWCVSPVRHLRDMRVEFLAKLYFLRQLRDKSITSLIDGQMRFLERLLSRVSDRRNLQTDDPALSDLASRFRAHQISAAIDWLTECKGNLDQQSQGAVNETSSV